MYDLTGVVVSSHERSARKVRVAKRVSKRADLFGSNRLNVKRNQDRRMRAVRIVHKDGTVTRIACRDGHVRDVSKAFCHAAVYRGEVLRNANGRVLKYVPKA